MQEFENFSKFLHIFLNYIETIKYNIQKGIKTYLF